MLDNISKITSNDIMVCLFPPLFQSLNHNLNTKKLKKEEGKKKRSQLEPPSKRKQYLPLHMRIESKKVSNLSKGAQWQYFSRVKYTKKCKKFAQSDVDCKIQQD